MTKSKNKKNSGTLAPTLYIVSTPIGNSGDWTQRAMDILSSVDVVAAEDTRVLKKEMAKIGIKPKKVVSHHDENEEASTKGLLEALRSGQQVALTTDAGTPQVSDPGYRVVRGALEAGIHVVPVPGASSLTCALSVSPLGGSNFFFGGFLPTQSESRKKILKRYRRLADNLIFFEAPHRLREMLREALEIFGPQTEIFICRELTKPYEEIKFSTLGDMVQFFNINEPRGEFVVCLKGAPIEALNTKETEEEVHRLLNHGRSASDIVSELQPVTELSRKQLYDLVIRNRKPDV